MTESRWQYFSVEELKCHCGECKSTGNEMDNQFMQMIVIVRQKVGFPLPVTSAYRCPAYNNKISSTGFHGAHTTGKAIDIGVSRGNALGVLKEALSLNIGGIGVQQKGESRFIHLDSCTASDGLPRPMIWSY